MSGRPIILQTRNSPRGKRDSYRCADADSAFQRQRSPMKFYHLPGQRKAKAGALIFACQRGIDLAEGLQRFGEILRSHAYSGI